MTSPLLTLPTIILQQNAKLTQLKENYKLLDENDQEIGSVLLAAESTKHRFLRVLSLNDSMLSKRYTIVDNNGTYVVGLHKQKHFTKPKVYLYADTGKVLAIIEAQFTLPEYAESGVIKDATGETIGTFQAQGQSYSMFVFADTSGQELARVVKQEVNLHKTLSQADRYSIQFSDTLNEDQRKITLGAAVSLDIILFPTTRIPF